MGVLVGYMKGRGSGRWGERGKYLFVVGVGVGYHLRDLVVGELRYAVEEVEIGFVRVVGFVGNLKVGDKRSCSAGQSLLPHVPGGDTHGFPPVMNCVIGRVMVTADRN